MSVSIKESQSTFSIFSGIWKHLSYHRRLQVLPTLVLMIASGGAELLSLGAVVPFLAVLNNPEQLWQQPLIVNAGRYLVLTESKDLVLLVTFIFVLAAVLAAITRMANLWVNGRFAAAIGSDLSCESYRLTLLQPYQIHLSRNTSVVITDITAKVDRTVEALQALFQFVTAIFVTASLLVGLFVIDWSVTLSAVAIFSGIYYFIAFFTRHELISNGHKIAYSSQLKLKSLQEGLGAIKEVLLDGNQLVYVDAFRKSEKVERKLIATNRFIGAFPRFGVEALGLVAIALLGALLVIQQGSSFSAIPLLGALALGGQRLLPAVQMIYGSWSSLKGFNADLAGVLEMLEQPVLTELKITEAFVLRESIRFEDVSFRYKPELINVIQNLDLQIRRGERIGLLGASGSGKSSLLDILMGLLKPVKGSVLIDGLDLHEDNHPDRLLAWHSSIAHVPQNVYLSDGTIAQNIAFGVPHSDIDLSRVKQSAEKAQLSGFIESCKNGYESFVGERGSNLSGGQKQRIGIARALYKNTPLIVFDEATSALDIDAESSIMNAIYALDSSHTLIIATHNPSNLQACDRILQMQKGQII